MPAQCLFSAVMALDQMEWTVRALLTPVRLDGSTGGLVVWMWCCIMAPSYGTVRSWCLALPVLFCGDHDKQIKIRIKPNDHLRDPVGLQEAFQRQGYCKYKDRRGQSQSQGNTARELFIHLLEDNLCYLTSVSGQYCTRAEELDRDSIRIYLRERGALSKAGMTAQQERQCQLWRFATLTRAHFNTPPHFTRSPSPVAKCFTFADGRAVRN
ncbi:hypothetical protein BGY98DRAFT_933287 [Russula aff. rugulosa BPL654]|nr:hypothetical protein BGY98DRAFT_933287 [Russula aff. rugulosa BPL654]